MRLWILSDIHTEFGPWEPPSIPDADICIAAGDIAKGGLRHVEWLAEHIKPHMPVVSVLGNHEFYGSSIEREERLADQAAARAGIHLLDDAVEIIDGVRFVGCTLWSDFDIYSKGNEQLLSRYMDIAEKGMNDYSTIKLRDFSTIPLEPAHTLRMHKESLQYLESELAQEFDGPTVVVTHHLPSPKSVASRFFQETITPAYASDLEWLIEKYQPTAWVHGHTHDSFDYQIGETRVICNPRGYPPERKARLQQPENADFDPALVVELDGYAPRPPGI